MDKGFTLIEVLIAMAILSIGILGVAAMQIRGINGNTNAGRVTSQASWAGNHIESIISLPYSHADLVAGDHSVASGNLTAATDGIDNNGNGQIDETGETGNVAISWNVTDDTPVDNTKTITVQVVGTNKTVTFDFIKADII